MSGICRSDAYVNNAGTGAPSFTYGLAIASGEVITTNTVNNTTSNAGVAIQGISGNTAGSSGYVGEYIASVISSAVNYPGSGSGNTLALTSIALTAGDWDIWASLTVNGNGTTFNSNSSSQVAIGTTSGSTTTGTLLGQSQYSFQCLAADVTGGAIAAVVTIAPFQILLSGSTTYYLNTYVNYSGTAPQALGIVAARRRR